MENKYTNTKWYNFLYILVKLDTKSHRFLLNDTFQNKQNIIAQIQRV